MTTNNEPVQNQTGVDYKGVDPKNPFIKIGSEASLEVINRRKQSRVEIKPDQEQNQLEKHVKNQDYFTFPH